jgi:signal transduction histidine kinase
VDEKFQDDIAAIGEIDAVPMILDVVCRSTGMGFAAVARVTEDRWIACSVRDDIQFGLRPGGELKVETTICDAIRESRQPVVIDHVSRDAVYSKHPTPAMYGFQSYISVPILRADGSFFGTLCAIDPRPARLNTPQIIGMFRLFAELIGFHLAARERVASSEATLRREHENAELREQFIAVLGHDLRNPLASISAGVQMLSRRPPEDKARHILKVIESSVGRMAELVDHVVDFARERLGQGLPVDRSASGELGPALEAVLAETRLATPGRVIEAQLSLAEAVDCDHCRIAQLFANLLANAVTHGAADRPIRVSASAREGAFELSVANAGAAIPPFLIDRLFQPFFRASAQQSQQGLGLGLYIASAIARAHRGTLRVASTQDETRFTFRMPTRPFDA